MVEITETRRDPSSNSTTTHKYLKGKMLGKGGFAKVYWCQSLDTNKAYAIKIVPKANLVKSRARQKLQVRQGRRTEGGKKGGSKGGDVTADDHRGR